MVLLCGDSYSRADMGEYVEEEEDGSTSTLAMRQLGLSVSYKDLANKTEEASSEVIKRSKGSEEEVVEKHDTEETRSTSSVEQRREMRRNSSESFFLLGQNRCGTVKKNILNSPYGFMFAWTCNMQPGAAVFNSLLLSVSCGASACAILLFVPAAHLTQAYLVIPLVVLFAVALLSLLFITAFNPDTTIKTFKVGSRLAMQNIEAAACEILSVILQCGCEK